MKKLALCSLILAFSAQLHATESPEQQAREYCSSMLQAGTPDDEAEQFLRECVSEQASYFMEQAEADKPDCYEQVDAYIEKATVQDPNQYYDYENLLDQCLSGKGI